MLDPVAPDGADARALRARRAGLRVVCLFPAMHRYSLSDPQGRRSRRRRRGHARRGALRALRRALGRRAPEARAPQPLRAALWPAARRAALRRSPTRSLPIIVPHFGAGFFREALMLADACPNVVPGHVEHERLDALSPGPDADRRVPHGAAVLGPDRLLFGTDSSFFPRGWQTPDLRHAARDPGAARHRGRLPRPPSSAALQPALSRRPGLEARRRSSGVRFAYLTAVSSTSKTRVALAGMSAACPAAVGEVRRG